MRPNKVEIAVQCSVCHMWVFAGFSCHGNLIDIISIPLIIYIYIYIYIYITIFFFYLLFGWFFSMSVPVSLFNVNSVFLFLQLNTWFLVTDDNNLQTFIAIIIIFNILLINILEIIIIMIIS